MGNAISWISDCNTIKGPIINTKYGSLCGKTFTFHDGRAVSAFLGVPFAKCGTYSERFQVLIYTFYYNIHFTFMGEKKYI